MLLKIKGSSLILTDKITGDYLIRKKKSEKQNDDTSEIIVKGKNEIKIYINILKDNVKVYEPDFVEDIDIIDWLKSKSLDEIRETLTLTRKDIANMDNILGRIEIKDSIYKELSNEKYNKRINKEYVHKTNKNNVMIGDCYRIHNTDLLVSKIILKTEEIFLDHVSSDHIQSILLSEVCRQSTVVSASLVQDPKLRFIVTQDIKNYKKFVTNDTPSYIQMICLSPKKKGVGVCMYNIVQNGVTCVYGHLTGFSYYV